MVRWNTSDGGNDSAAWASIALLALGVVLCQAYRPLAIAPAGLISLFAACTALFGTATFYRVVRPRPDFAVMCVALAQVILFSTLGVILSYLLARTGGELWDGRFAAWDRALGFDWLSYVRFIDSSAMATALYKIAYASLIPQIIVLVLCLGFAGRTAALRAVMLAAIIAGTATILLSPFFPAVSNYVFRGLGPHDFVHVNPFAGTVHLADFTALRDGTTRILTLDKMEGIITFPSYHAGLSVVTLWGFSMVATRLVRWPGVLLSATTIAATPVDGGHYLVDILAGGAIAVAAILIARQAIYWRPLLGAFNTSPFHRSHAASAP